MKRRNLKTYADFILRYADEPFTPESLIRWLAPGAIQLGPAPMPPDKIYYLVQEKVTTLRTPHEALGVLWWPTVTSKQEVEEVHMRPAIASVGYKELVAELKLVAEVGRNQGHALADVEHIHPLASKSGHVAHVTLNEIVFAEDPELIGMLGGLTVKKMAAVPPAVKRLESVPKSSSRPPNLHHHLLIGRWKALERRSPAEILEFDLLFAAHAGEKGNIFRTYTEQRFLDQGVWTLQDDSRLRLVWKSGLIQSFEIVLKGDRLILRDGTGLFRYRRTTVTAR